MERLKASDSEATLLLFKDFAKILAIVVLPTPLIPVKRYAFGTLSDLIEFLIVSETIS